MASRAETEGVTPSFEAALVMLNALGLITAWSDEAEELLGYTASEVLKQPVGSLLVSGDLVDAPGEGGLPARRAARDQCVVARHRDGRRLGLIVRVSVLTDDDGAESRLLQVLPAEQTPWYGVERSAVRRLLEDAPVGVAVLDPDLRCVWLNDAQARVGGVSRERRLGQGLDAVFPPSQAAELGARIRRVLETGVPLIDHEYQGATMADPAGRAYSASFARLQGPRNRVLGVACLVLDVTERWRARQRRQLMSEFGDRIEDGLDITRTAQSIAHAAVPLLGDYAAVDLLDTALPGGALPDGRARRRVPLRRAGQESLRPLSTSGPAVGDEVRTQPASVTARAVSEGRGLLDRIECSDGEAASAEQDADGHVAALVREFGAHSLIAVPITSPDGVLGVMSVARALRSGPFTDDDVLFVQQFTTRAAAALARAHRYSREHVTALALQQSLLPHSLPPHSPARGSLLDVAWRYLPADTHGGVGGDWFDVIPLSGARVALVVGDVVGHGVHAAATMGQLRTAVQTLAAMDLTPEELLANLDDLVVRLAEEETSDGEGLRFGPVGTTCLYIVYDPVLGECTAAGAGHPPPALLAPDGTVTFLDLPPAPPLGVATLSIESVRWKLREESLLVLFTDGLITCGGRDLGTGMTRLSEALAHAGCGDRSSLDGLCGKVAADVLDQPLWDDAALLMARTRILAADRVARWDLPTDPAVVTLSRELAMRQLAEWGLDELAFTTELIVSEMVTNAVRYGKGPLTLRLIHHDALICEVFDRSNTAPRLQNARTLDEGGRGLFLVAQLSKRWGVRYTEPGKVVWAEQDLP
ncbi:SpoIIE family protein phosphatase [Streptomyces sp. NRRL S-813]|uniref:SpoIIE family protein phosphatase n=1 Tax=Streptomyces sp. NRRL S-813 TaxID=1463919 RepID=UPI0004C092DF|nr:SpoIIE family protein phosphatase [Streptomyces sp. NRRL S-813]